MLSARDAANLVPINPETVLRQLETAIREAAIAGRSSITASIGPFGLGQGKLWDAVVSILVQQPNLYKVDFKDGVTTISWG